MYCTHCGKEIDDNAVICVNCGVLTANFNKPQNVVQEGKDVGLYKGMGIGCFIISLASLFLGMITILPAIGLSLGMVSVSKKCKNACVLTGIFINAVVLIGFVVLYLLCGLSIFFDWGW